MTNQTGYFVGPVPADRLAMWGEVVRTHIGDPLDQGRTIVEFRFNQDDYTIVTTTDHLILHSREAGAEAAA